MKNLMLAIAMLMGLSCIGQRSYVLPRKLTPYENRVDSIVFSRSLAPMDYKKHRDMMLTWMPLHRIKVTVKTRVNKDIISKIVVSDGLNDMFDNLDTEDFLSLGAYDVRVKLYVNRDIRLIGRVLIAGIQTQKYFYSFGVNLKF